MTTYTITFESNIGMLSFHYATKQFTATTAQEAREMAQAWADTMPERDCVAIERIKESA